MWTSKTPGLQDVKGVLKYTLRAFSSIKKIM
jgi:hypothetical protein